MKSILLIGLGRFGRHVAMKLHELKHEVLAIDQDEQQVNDILPYVTDAQIGDSTNEAFVTSLGVRNFDVCIVAIGDDFQSSLETTLLLKEQGAKFVVARASRDVHAKFLLRNGADDVVYLEKEIAAWTAVRYTANHVFDYIELNEEYSIYEIDPPEEWLGKSLMDLRVRQRYQVNVLAIRREDSLDPLPEAEHVFREGERVFIMGSNKVLRKFLKD